MAAKKHSPTVGGESFWTPGKIAFVILGSVVVIGLSVAIGIILIRANNYNRQVAIKAANETAKQIAEAKEKSLNAPPDSSDATPNDDPIVTQSVLDKAQKSQWKKMVDYVCRKFRFLKDYIVQCQNENPQVRTPGKRGRVQNNVRRILFDRAILYQLSHSGCSQLNACKRAFKQVKDGYKTPRSLYEFWRTHPVDADQAKTSLSEAIATSGLSLQKFCEKFDRDNARILQENSV